MTVAFLALTLAAFAAPKNIVLYVADDWGHDAGCFGHPIVKTPHLDALAREGTRFERAYGTTASCSPSRSVILTGLHNHANGQYGLEHATHHFNSFAGVRTLPVMLAADGYRTARVGKFHVAPEEAFKFEQVFQANQRNGIAMAEACRAWFAADDTRPFFLYICSSDPHRSGGVIESDPQKPNAFGNEARYPGITETTYEAKDVIVPPWLPDTAACRAEIAQYYQAVSRFDAGVGHLVKILRETGRYDDTLIIVTTDNGMPFPGAKTTLYEAGIHLPLIVRAPGQKTRGGTCDAMVSWTDFTPTILDFAGVQPAPAPPLNAPRGKPQPVTFHGRSWAGLWDEPAPAGWDEVFASHTFHEVTMYYPMRAVQTRKWKFIMNLAHQLPFPFASDLWSGATWQATHTKGESRYGGRLVADYIQRPRYELYDVETDPQNFKNLAADPAHAATVEMLSAKLKTFQQQTRDPWLIKYEHE